MTAAAATYPLETIAKLLMLTPRRVQQLVKEGHIPRAERGRYELVPAVQGYIRYLKDRAIGADAEGGEASDKARLVKARADIAEFEAGLLEGELVRVSDVEAADAEKVSRFKARALSIPSKAAPLVAQESRPDVCQEIVQTFVFEALAELSEIPVESRAAVGRRDAPGAGASGAAAEADDLAMG